MTNQPSTIINESPEASCHLPAARCPLSRMDSTDSLVCTAEQSNGRTAERLSPQWHVLWTRTHSEQMVYDQLAPKGFDLFLPMMDVWARHGGLRHRVHVPMLPGYLFLHHAIDESSYIEVRNARGLVKLLGESWDRLAAVPDKEIQAIKTVHQAPLPTLPHPYLREGQRVRVTSGLLAGVEGIFLRSRPNKGLLVISIHLLQRSVAVEVDCTLVEAV